MRFLLFQHIAIGHPGGGDSHVRSSLCDIQARGVGSRALGVQDHLEMDHDTVSEWGRVPAYAVSPETTLGRNALSDMERACCAGMTDSNAASRCFFDDFLIAPGLAA